MEYRRLGRDGDGEVWQESECVYYARIIWPTSARQGMAWQGSRPAQKAQYRLSLSRPRSRRVAGRLGTWLTAYSQAKANKDCPAAYEKRLGQRLPFAVLSLCQMSLVRPPLLSWSLPSRISWKNLGPNGFTSTAFISTTVC
jgi:hypothetical protein